MKENLRNFFSLKSLIEVITHELVHAILTDIQPETQEINGGHGKEHDEMCEEMVKMIEASPEYQELKKFWK